MKRELFTLTLTDAGGNIVASKGVFLRSKEDLPGQEYTWGIKGRELFRDALWHLGLWDEFQQQRDHA